MIKTLVFILTTCILALVLTMIGPWWLIIVGPILMGFILKVTLWRAFLLGALGTIVFWGALIAYRTFGATTIILERIAYLLQLNGSKVWLVVVTLIIGGIIGGVAALHGAFLRKSMRLQ